MGDDLRRDRKRLLEIYSYLQLNRRIEERLALLYRQGKVVGALYRSLGQEATSVGSAYALEKDDLLSPMIRNLGSVLVRGTTPREVFLQHMARAESPNRGKDSHLHFGPLERGIVGTISHLGTMIPVMAGVAFAQRYRNRKSVALVYIGDGGTSTGEFHEGLNFAAVRKLPLIVVAENNGYAYSTPTRLQMAIENIADRARAYGIAGETVDGNDVLAVYDATRRAAERAREGAGPTLLEAKTFRMRGHAEHDDMKYVPKKLLEEWARKDPIARFEKLLLREKRTTRQDLEKIVREIEAKLDEDVAYAEAAPLPESRAAQDGVYAP